ncbi:hypothetical protein TYRP_004314 [Tyrophagus putrescentiae]|nr:hypothetical protein TYRP_004314 [Tyrophagus putrescentiae]
MEPSPSPATLSIWQRARTQLYRHRIILTVPPFLFYLIYADYSRTQRWKREQALASNSIKQ